LKNISAQIKNYQDEILEDVVRLVEIPSVREDAKPGMPFGEGPAKALDFCLSLAKSMGFAVKNVDHYAGHIEYGEGEGLIGVLAHCDVVPAGEGWTKPPFSGTVENDRIYGRGAMDDKGPAIAAIYCLKALKDLGIVPKRRIRVIIGASEECGMEDLTYYFAHEEMPDMAFSPDGRYPICNREKGIMQVRFSHTHDARRPLTFEAGLAPNVVPVSARARIQTIDSSALKKAAADFESDGQSYGLRFAFENNSDGLGIVCNGKAAHASTPEEGVNAAAGLITLLAQVLGKDAGTLADFLNKTIGLDYTGQAMGIACSDEPSGNLTLNLGVVQFTGEADSAIIDIRYPVTCNGNEIYQKIEKAAEIYGVTPALISDSAPLFVDENSELILKLKHAYTTATGKEAELFSMGGGTYARQLKNRGVAFGAEMDKNYNIHSADEFIDINDFMKHCEICLQAIYELCL
jgi:succinyl-diaminopimelate desuccinylase